MTSALSLMDISENLAAFLPGYALQIHTIGAMPVEVPFDQRVSFSLTGDAFYSASSSGRILSFR